MTFDPAESNPAATVVIVDDHPLLAHGLCRELRETGVKAEVVVPPAGVEVSPGPADGMLMESLIESLGVLEPELVLVDLDMPIPGGGAALVEALAPTTRVAVLTGSADQLAWCRCLDAGARVVLSKADPLDRLLSDITALLSDSPVRVHQRRELEAERRRFDREGQDRQAGFDQLSCREAAVLGGLMTGLSAGDIAGRDCVSVETVRSQIKSVLHKLGVRSQLAAVARAHSAGWKPMTTVGRAAPASNRP